MELEREKEMDEATTIVINQIEEANRLIRAGAIEEAATTVLALIETLPSQYDECGLAGLSPNVKSLPEMEVDDISMHHIMRWEILRLAGEMYCYRAQWRPALYVLMAVHTEINAFPQAEIQADEMLAPMQALLGLHMGLAYLTLGMRTQALHCLDGSLDALGAHFGVISQPTYQCQYNLAVVHYQQGNFALSLKWIQCAHDTGHHLFDATDPHMGSVAYHTAQCHFALGNFPACKVTASIAAGIFESHYGNKSSLLADALALIASCQMKSLDNADQLAAVLNHERVLGIRMKVYGEESPVVAASYNSIGCAHLILGRYEKARPHLLASHSLYHHLVTVRLMAQCNQGLVNSAFSLAQCYAQYPKNSSEFLKAEELFDVWFPRAQEEYGIDHPQLLTYLKFYLDHLGNTDDQVKHRKVQRQFNALKQRHIAMAQEASAGA